MRHRLNQSGQGRQSQWWETHKDRKWGSEMTGGVHVTKIKQEILYKAEQDMTKTNKHMSNYSFKAVLIDGGYGSSCIHSGILSSNKVVW